MPLLPAYTASVNTGRVFTGVRRKPGDINAEICVLEYGPLRPLLVLSSSVTERRAIARTADTRGAISIAFEQHGDMLLFPERTTLAPIRARVGTRVVVRVELMPPRDGHHDKQVCWRCDCKRTGRMQISRWRSMNDMRCNECAKASSKAGYNPMPATTMRQRIEADAERARRNPLMAVPS